MGYHGRMESAVKFRIDGIRSRIAAAAKRAGRDPAAVTLMAVTKTYGRGDVLAAYEAGIRVFGENRVLEAAGKYMEMPADIELHLIGHLQTNKAKTAAEVFRWVDSIDSRHTAAALDRRLEAAGKSADILLELNTSGESSKSGYPDMDTLLKDLPGILSLPRLRFRGLLTIGPLSGGREAARASFRTLKTCFDRLRTLPGCEAVDVLSMGMSSDFEIAVEEGSTMVRLGTALFGERPA